MGVNTCGGDAIEMGSRTEGGGKQNSTTANVIGPTTVLRMILLHRKCHRAYYSSKNYTIAPLMP